MPFMKTIQVQLPLLSVTLTGELTIPQEARGIIVFSHGSGSSRFSPRNRFVAGIMQKHGFATLLFDLLTEAEDAVYEKRFDTGLLAGRLVEVSRWLAGNAATRGLEIAYFGASTGAASALKAAAVLGEQVKAIVSRGGRPDLAMPVLGKVTAPVQLIVGGYDTPVIEMNRAAFAQLKCRKELVVVPMATHLFEEPGKLEEVAELAAGWYETYVGNKRNELLATEKS